MLFAVHISDGVLSSAWWVGGWVAAAALLAYSAWRVRDHEVPRIGVLTAAFFVASQIHLPLGGVSVHLLLNGLVGVVLGRRAVLALAVGLFLQALLFGHGGFTTLGINITVYSIPALLAGRVFHVAWRQGWLRQPAFRSAAVALTIAAWLAAASFAVQWTIEWFNIRASGGVSSLQADVDRWWISEPTVVLAIIAASIVLAAAERRLERDPNFPLGLLLGAGTTAMTVGLNCLVLWLGGLNEVRDLAGIVFLMHLPVVVVESAGVGFVVAFLAKTKPEWLAGYSACGSTSSSGTSH